MKKLALVLTFIFAAAMIAPAFADGTTKKNSDKAVVAKETPKEGKACSTEDAKACEKKEAAGCCAKKEAAACGAKKEAPKAK